MLNERAYIKNVYLRNLSILETGTYDNMNRNVCRKIFEILIDKRREFFYDI